MDDAALQKFAAMNKNDPYLLPLAISESNRRKRVRSAAQAQQAQPQPPVADAAVAQMAPAMPQMAAGIPQLQARNLETMADGGIAGYAKGGAPQAERDKYRAYAIEKARQLGLDPKFVDAIFQTESGYDPNAKSKTGPVGIGQLAKQTARAKGLKPEERKDPYKNMDASLSLMQDFFKKYRDPAKVAVAYNQGEGVLNRHLKKNKGQLVPEKLHEDVRTSNKQEPFNYLKKLNNYIPLPVAAAADVVPRDEFKPTEIKNPTPVAQPKPARTAPAPTPRRAGPAPVAEEAMVDPMGNIISTPPTATGTIEGKAPQAGAAAATADYFANLLPFAAGEIAYGGARMATVPEETALGARAAAKDFMDPFGRMFGRTQEPGYRQAPTTQLTDFVSKNLDKSAEWLSKNAPDGTLSVNDASNIQNLLLLGLGRGKGKPKEEAGLPGISARQKAAEAEAAAAAERAQTAALPRLDGPKPEAKAAYAFEPRKSQTFPISPEAAAFGAEATSRRKLGEQARDVRKAEEAATAAAKRAEAIRAEEAARAADQAGRTQVGAVARSAIPSARNIPRAAVGTNQAEMPETAPPVSDVYPNEENRGVKPEPDATPSPAPAPVAEERPPAEQKKAFGLDNEDLLMLGLGMLASPGGQAGGELSQLFSNFGRAGLGAVAAKREREKLAQEKSFKDIMEKYYGKLAENLDTSREERQIQQVMKEYNVDRLEAIRRIAAAQYDPRMAAMFGVQNLKNEMSPMSILRDGGGGTEGFTVLGKRPG